MSGHVSLEYRATSMHNLVLLIRLELCEISHLTALSAFGDHNAPIPFYGIIFI